jgi:hypothetical protein
MEMPLGPVGIIFVGAIEVDVAEPDIIGDIGDAWVQSDHGMDGGKRLENDGVTLVDQFIGHASGGDGVPERCASADDDRRCAHGMDIAAALEMGVNPPASVLHTNVALT